MGNAEVLEMVAAQFSDATIVATIAANTPRFDISPRALVALKSAGVSERVIEAMLAAETAKREAAAEPPREDPAAGAAARAAEEYAKLSEMIERLAAQQEAAAAAQRVSQPPPRSDPAPRAWILNAADKTLATPTIAQVAFTGARRGTERFRSLQVIAGQALAFANPAASGIASTLGSLFRADEERTAVWALTAASSGRVLDARAAFEVEYAYIPGVDPDGYQPAIVRLVPTADNYRLVAAAETDGDRGALPRGPIIEEPVATELTRLGRGLYRVVPRGALHPGEYALVLRPVEQTKRRRRDTEASLGELLGGGTSQILYLTWDFAVAAP